MEPRLPDGCSVLIKREQRERRHGRVFVVLVSEDELIVRPTLEEPEAGWLIASNKPDKRASPTRTGPEGAEAIGEVRWVWFSLP